MHHIQANSLEHAIEQLLENEVSSHYIIDEKGKLFELVAEKNIAYHAGLSNWKGQEGLNKNSIGIEFVNSDPENIKFPRAQLRKAVKLCQYLMEKYQISAQNVIGHSDIGYYSSDIFEEDARLAGFLDRKQDPSHLFDWGFLAKNGVGAFPDEKFSGRDKILFRFGDKDEQIAEIRKKLNEFGYKVGDFGVVFDLEMRNLTRVFNRRFNPRKYAKNPDIWWKSSQFYLDQLLS